MNTSVSKRTRSRRSSGEDAEEQPPEKRARGPEAHPLPGPLPGFEATAETLRAFCVGLFRHNVATFRPHLAAVARENKNNTAAKDFAASAEVFVGQLSNDSHDPWVVDALIGCCQAARHLVETLEETGAGDERRSPLRSWRALTAKVEAAWAEGRRNENARPDDQHDDEYDENRGGGDFSVRFAPHLTAVGDAELALRDLRAARDSPPALWHIGFQLLHANVASARTAASDGRPRTLGWVGPAGGWGKLCALLHQGTYPPLHGPHWLTTASDGRPLQKSVESAFWYVTPSLASTSPPRTSSPRRDR